MAICPNCGARVGLNNKCPHCGSLLKTQNSNSNSFIEQLKDVTSDFSQKPTCSKEVFEGLVVNALLTASETEKNIYQARIIDYTNNYLNGGTGIINNPQKSDYINRGENAEGRYVTNGTYSDAVAYKPHRQRMPRAKLAFLLACIVGGLAIIVGTSVGVPLGVRASKENKIAAVRQYGVGVS